MWADITWSELTLVPAFALGMLVGIIVTIRLTKIIAEWLRREERKD